MTYIGGLIVILTAIAIVKKVEVRLVLFISGILMALLAGDIVTAVDAFTTTMTSGSLIPILTTVMGFSYVLKLTKCDLHLIHFITGPMTKFQAILIPLTVIMTALMNIALTSAAGVAAAVGAIFIPALIKAGVHPIMAATAVFAGTFGGNISPGNAQVAHVAEIAETTVVDVALYLAPIGIVSILISAITLTIVAMALKENKGYVPAADEVEGEGESFKPSPLKAIVPIVPLAMIILGSPAVGLLENEITVPEAMLFGVFLVFLVTWKNPQEMTKSFFDGMGASFAKIVGIILAAAVFTTGMDLIGLTGALIDLMQDSESIVAIAGIFGPFILAVVSGSGIAAALAFNNSITPYAAEFGFEVMELGAIATFAGALGRTMSPVAGAGIICAAIAKVNPMDCAKRNVPGMLIAAVVVLFMFLM